jgi:hypothetical protein
MPPADNNFKIPSGHASQPQALYGESKYNNLLVKNPTMNSISAVARAEMSYASLEYGYNGHNRRNA